MVDEAKQVSAWDKLNADVQERAGVEIADLPHKRTYFWVPRCTPLEIQMISTLKQAANEDVPYKELLASMQPMLIQRHGDWPMNDDYLVAEMFDDGDADLLVYVVSKKDQTLGVRYRINKQCSMPAFGVEEMPMDVWLDQLAEEWKAVESDIDYEEVAVEDERNATIAYIQTLPKDYSLEDLVGDLEDENHLVPVDEEEEEEEEGKPAAAAESKVSAPVAAPSAPARTTEEAAAPTSA